MATEETGLPPTTASGKEKEPSLSSFLKFLTREEGPAAVEFAVLLALIVVVCIAAITVLDQPKKTEEETPTATGETPADPVVP